WAEEHGDTVDLPPIRWYELVEEVATTHADDGTERNATFAADHRSVGREEVETTLRRAAFARDDLLAALERFGGERSSGDRPTPADGGNGRATRELDAAVRHVATAETWLASRLDGSLRYRGPGPDGPLRDHLAESRKWVVAQVRELAARDPAPERTDGKGETWTLAKVLRRILYHSLDHLWELELRLARAEAKGDGVVVTLDRRPPTETVARLLRSVGWDARALDMDRLDGVIDGAREVACAWDGDRLVGFGRSISDGVMSAYLATIIVDPRWQGLGVGERVVRALTEGHESVRFALAAAPGLQGWYAKLGFEPDPRAMVRRPG
ncbi:MAG: GNAT family N-acetyltransferase, partial [Chloroflexota bacterium]